MFRIDIKHIVEPSSNFPDFSLALTELAEVIMERSIADCSAKLEKSYGRPRLANKKALPLCQSWAWENSGRESLAMPRTSRSCSSTVDRAAQTVRMRIENSEYFERLAQELLGWIEAKQESIYRIDVRLPPTDSTAEARALANAFAREVCQLLRSDRTAPRRSSGKTLIKLRHIAGDSTRWGINSKLHRDSIRLRVAPWDIPAALELRRQQLRQMVAPGKVNVKYSAGGLIDIEYAAQYLQVMHGHDHPSLRTPNTLRALARVGQ